MRPYFDSKRAPSDVEIGVVVLLLGHLAHGHRGPHRLREVFEAEGAFEEEDVALDLALADEPAVVELLEQRRDLLAGERRDAAAAGDAVTLRQIAHKRHVRRLPGSVLPVIIGCMRERRRAAVVIAILRDAPHGVVFVERALHLRDHPGQIGLPGGSVHPQDADLAATALRELHEEVGIERERVTIVAQLPMVSQRRANNFDVTPFVAVVEPGELRLDASETAGAFLVPLATIVEGGLREGRIQYEGLHLSSLVLDFEGHRIWGFTARILEGFVAHWNGGLRTLVERTLASRADSLEAE